MNLSEKSEKNISFMINEIKSKLQLVNQSLLRPENYDAENYDELHDIYQYVVSQPSVSVSEMDAILSELGNIRKN